MIANDQVSAKPSASAQRRPEWTGCAPGAANGMDGLLVRSHGYNGGSGAWSTHSYEHADGKGNVTMLLNASQTAVATDRYDPFGNTTYASGSLANANTMRFGSKSIHATGALYNYGYRWYSPNLQRWLSRDPIGERGGTNLSTFVPNRPVKSMDRSATFGRSSSVFRRTAGLLNKNDWVRVGWAWKGARTAGREAFRVAIGGPLRTGPTWLRKAWQWTRHFDLN